MAETSTIFGFMKYVSATDILSDFKKTVDSYFVNSLKSAQLSTFIVIIYRIYCRDFFDQTKHSLLCCLWKYLFLEY